MAQAIRSHDTAHESESRVSEPTIIGRMTLTAVPDWDYDDTPWVLAELLHLRPHCPTDEEIAAKKARRRLDRVEQVPDRTGVVRPRYLNADGYDAWGKDVRGRYNPAQDTRNN